MLKYVKNTVIKFYNNEGDHFQNITTWNLLGCAVMSFSNCHKLLLHEINPTFMNPH